MRDKIILIGGLIRSIIIYRDASLVLLSPYKESLPNLRAQNNSSAPDMPSLRIKRRSWNKFLKQAHIWENPKREASPCSLILAPTHTILLATPLRDQNTTWEPNNA